MGISESGDFCYFKCRLDLERPGDAYVSIKYINGIFSRKNVIYRDYSYSSFKFIFNYCE